MNVAYRAYGHPSRKAMMDDLQRSIGLKDSEIFFDDGLGNGYTLYVARKAWLSPKNPDETHRCVMQEDIKVCEDFKEIVQKMCESHPDDVISLYPYEYMNRYPISRFTKDTPYYIAGCISGCGIVMPTKYIDRCFNWLSMEWKNKVHDDLGIKFWCDNANVRYLFTIPSTIQHIGDSSIVSPTSGVRRTIHFIEKPVANWSSQEVIDDRKHKRW